MLEMIVPYRKIYRFCLTLFCQSEVTFVSQKYDGIFALLSYSHIRKTVVVA